MQITLSGIIAGSNWYNQFCAMSFSQTFDSKKDKPFSQKWPGLRNAVLSITSQGDFQDANLAQLSLSVTKETQYTKDNRTRVNVKRYIIELDSNCKQITDCFLNAEDTDKAFDIMADSDY